MRVIEGDCVEAMAAMPEASVDAIVTDPPYGLEFMGKDWDRLSTRNDLGGVRGHDQGFGPRTSNPTCRNCGGLFHLKAEGSGGRKKCVCASPSFPDWRAHDARKMQEWHEAWAREALRVLKPGGHLLAFGGTRTSHRLACAIEDAGFEIRDSLIWLYGSGFPKSLDVSKAINRAAGAEREVVGRAVGAASQRTEALGPFAAEYDATAPATPDAERWQGWGTALKPAHEPIVVARKPLVGTVAANVLAHGTGALNVDGCRIAGTDEIHAPQSDPSKREGVVGADLGISGAALDDFRAAQRASVERANTMGRWPANVALSHSEGCVCVGERRVPSNAPARYASDAEAALYGDGLGKRSPGDERPGYADEDGLEMVEAWECVEGCPVAELDRQSGAAGGSGRASGPTVGQLSAHGIYGTADGERAAVPFYGDEGGASRFFYTAKASRAERNAGLAGFAQESGDYRPNDDPEANSIRERLHGSRPRANSHPTVKPIDLMRWLVRLVTPPGGTVLDPFLGSGTTGCAATLEGFDFIGIEREAEYVKIAEARIAFWQEHPEGLTLAQATQAEVKRGKTADAGQASIFDLID